MKRPPVLAPLSLLVLTGLALASCDSKPLGGTTECTYGGKTYASGASFPASDGCNTCSCQNGQVPCTLLGCTDGSTDKGAPTCFDNQGNMIACPGLDAGGSDVHPGDGGATDGAAKDAVGTCYDANGKTIPCTTDAGAGCTYDGKVYKVGAAFTCGCNTCTCVANGEIGSTTSVCPDGSSDSQSACFDSAGNTIPCKTDAGVECVYGDKTYPVGAAFPSSDGCNMCGCDTYGMISCTQKACGDGGLPGDGGADAPATCFDANGKMVPCGADGGPTGVCTPGADQRCNDDPSLNTLLGKCR